MWWSASSADSHYLLYCTNRTIVDNTSPVLLSGDSLTTERAPHGVSVLQWIRYSDGIQRLQLLANVFPLKKTKFKTCSDFKEQRPQQCEFLSSLFLSFFFIFEVTFYFILTYFFVAYLVCIIQSHTSSPFSPLCPYSFLLLWPLIFTNFNQYWIPCLCIAHVWLDVAVSQFRMYSVQWKVC